MLLIFVANTQQWCKQCLTPSTVMSPSNATWSSTVPVYGSVRHWVWVMPNAEVNLSSSSKHTKLSFTFRRWEKINLLSVYFSLNTVLDISTCDIMFNSNKSPENKNDYPHFYQQGNEVIQQIIDFPKNILGGNEADPGLGPWSLFPFLIYHAASGHWNPSYVVIFAMT